MTSKYFNESEGILDNIKPVFDFESLNVRDNNYWYLRSHLYETWCWQDDVFCEDELNTIIKLGNLFSEQEAQVGNNGGVIDKTIRDCKLSWFNINQNTNWIYKKLTDSVNSNNENFFKFDLDKIETLQFAKYREEDSGFYDKHIDPFVGEREPHNRKLSFVVQLSSPDDYEGGELALYFGKEPTIIKKQRGRIVFFPSYTLHEVRPVTKGVRYSLVGWVHGPAFK